MLPFITMSASSSAEVGDLFITASRLPLKNLISRRLHREGGSADNQQVGVGYRVYRRVYVGFVERLLVEHYVGLDYPAAGAARNPVGGGDELQPVGLPALHAVIPANRTVQFDDVFAARVGVQPVDVLGHNCG